MQTGADKNVINRRRFVIGTSLAGAEVPPAALLAPRPVLAAEGSIRAKSGEGWRCGFGVPSAVIFFPGARPISTRAPKVDARFRLAG